MIRTLSLLITLTLFLFQTHNVAHAKPLKVAFVDMSRVLNEAESAKKKRAELDKLSTKIRKEIEEKKRSLSKMQSKLSEKQLSPESSEVRDFRNKAKDFERFVKDSNEDIQRQFVSFNKKLTKKALDLINEYSEDNDLDLVLDKSTGGKSPVLFGNTSAEITDKILEEMNG